VKKIPFPVVFTRVTSDRERRGPGEGTKPNRPRDAAALTRPILASAQSDIITGLT
jgi:hypothetical protein